MDERAVMVMTSELQKGTKLVFCAKSGGLYVGVGKSSTDDFGSFYLYDPDTDQACPIPTMFASNLLSEVKESDIVFQIKD